MQNPSTTNFPIPDFTLQYERHLVSVRGLACNTVDLHRLVVQKLLRYSFPDGEIIWNDFQFSHCVGFLKKEFSRLHSCETQRVWLMVLRSFLRYLAEDGYIAKGWDAALPKRASYSFASLPRRLSQEQIRDLLKTCRGKHRRYLRYKAILLLSLRLGLRTGEIANLHVKDIDWKNGYLQIRGTKTYQDRVLPLTEEIGKALVSHLAAGRSHPIRVFEPLRPPFTAERSYNHVANSAIYLFKLAGVRGCGVLHSLRHTAATAMISKGASFKEVADVLGHKSITSTLIYAKLDLKALKQVALPWPGGAQ